MHCPVDDWPSSKFDVNTTTIELKSTGCKPPSNVLVAITNPNISNILNVETFSSLHRLYTVLAYVLRFKHNMLEQFSSLHRLYTVLAYVLRVKHNMLEQFSSLHRLYTVLAYVLRFKHNMLEQFSSLHRLYIVLAYVLRFKHNMLEPIRNTGIGDLSVSELNCAENVSIKFEQSEISNEKLGVVFRFRRQNKISNTTKG